MGSSCLLQRGVTDPEDLDKGDFDGSDVVRPASVWRRYPGLFWTRSPTYALFSGFKTSGAEVS